MRVRSRTNAARCSSRARSSRARRIDDGWTVATTRGSTFLGLEHLTAVLGHLERATEDRLRGGRPQAHEDRGLDDGQLGVEPGTARRDLRHRGLAMDAALPPHPLPAEVLDRVGEVDLGSVQARLGEGSVQDGSRRPDERPALFVLAVAGLLTDEHQPRRDRSLAEHGLRPEVVQIAPGADLGRAFQGP
jgi:hypothetical protein